MLIITYRINIIIYNIKVCKYKEPTFTEEATAVRHVIPVTLIDFWGFLGSQPGLPYSVTSGSVKNVSKSRWSTPEEHKVILWLRTHTHTASFSP